MGIPLLDRLLTTSLLVAALLAGCGSNDSVPIDPDHEPARLSVDTLDSTPANYVSWSRIADEKRPPELPPLFEKALPSANGRASETVSDQRGEAIMAALEEEWRTQTRSFQAAPKPLPVLYNGGYWGIFFSPSFDRTA